MFQRIYTLLLRSIITTVPTSPDPLLPHVPNAYKYTYALVRKDQCFYCERPANSMDHILPQRVAELLPYERWPKELLQIVPCCKQCNSIAGAKLFTTVRAKQQFIRMRLKRMHMLSVIADVLK